MPIKVNSFTADPIITQFAGEGLWKLAKPCIVIVRTDEGVLRYQMNAGFLTDMRSGSNAINKIIPKFTENNLYNAAILCHDFAYTRGPNGSHFLSKDLADELLRQMVIVSGQLGAWKASLMKTAVKLFGGSAYKASNDFDYGGRAKQQGSFMSFRWDAK